MADRELEGMLVAVLATDDFEESELLQPKQALEEAGATVQVIAPHGGEIQAIRHDEKTERCQVDATIDEADPDRFDGLLLPGGALNADALRINPKAQEFVRAFDRRGKPLAVICHAPWLLASANLLRGRTLTSYETIQDDIRNAGGNWVNQEVCRDGNLVTSRKPADISAFNREVIGLLAERRSSAMQRPLGDSPAHSVGTRRIEEPVSAPHWSEEVPGGARRPGESTSGT